MEYPLISILVCTYNGSRFVEKQVQSLLDQTYPNIEIIISDDASTDGTDELLKRFNNSRIILNFNKNNTGLQKNIETAVKLSRGEFIAFADQDDVWFHEKIEKLYNAIGNFDLVYSDSILVNEQGDPINMHLSDARVLQDIHNSKYLGLMNAVSGHTMLARRKVVMLSLPIPPGYYHDWWIAVQASNLNGIKYLNEKLTYYRQHDTNLTKNIIVKGQRRRAMQARYQQYLIDVGWLELIKNNPLEKNRDFYKQFHELFRQKERGYFSWMLYFFLIKNQQELFKLYPKGFLSRLFEARKIARGEKRVE